MFNGGNGASTASGGADGPQDSPDDHAPLNPEGPESVSGESSDDAEVSDSDSDEVSESTAGPTPARISGRLTRRSKYRSGTTAGACVDVPEQGGFFLYVGSGPLWENSVSAHVLKMTGQHVVSVDLKVGGYNHDISSPPVAKELRRLADDPRCLGVLGSIPCKTYSPARSAPATGALIRSKPLRDDKNPLGHRDAQGNLPTVVHRANEAAQLLADMCAKVHRRGKPFVVETTPSRGRDAAFPLPGRGDHVGMLDMPSFRDLAKATGARTTHFDQCMTRDDPTTTPEKKTVLFYSAAWHPIVQSQFAHLMCSHGPGSHPSMLGMADDGTARSSKWENYSGVMNERLARCLTWSPPAQPAAGLVPMDDWAIFYNQSHATYEDDTAGVEKNVVAMLASVVAYVGDAFSRQLYDTCVDEQCFAAPRTANSDSPTLRQAMEGPDRDLWAASRQNEYENFTRHEVFEPVLEDTLSTWNIIKKVATEVVPLLEVMVKKYIDSVFHKCKTRWVVDGSRQKFENARAEHPLDTFAPTVRHSTHKLEVANATMNGAAPTTLSSKAYLERIAKEVLPKPLSEYPKYSTPCSIDIMKHYETAIANRHNVSEELRKSYPVKVGKIVYALPASRADCAYAIGMCTRCLNCPTEEMDQEADRCLIYMAQTSTYGPHFSAQSKNPELHAYSDSDWQIGCSTSGWCIFYAGAVVSYGSKRQNCIALSSTEAEIMAASQAAAEVLYIRGLLREMGVKLDKPTVLYVDNSGAVELSKDLKSCQRSRHIERRYLKVRELVAQGDIEVRYCPTKENVADALTKSLPPAVHKAHTESLLNLDEARRSEANQSGCAPTRRQRTFDVEAAYLKGKFEDGEVVHVRPPRGYRSYIQGVAVVWRLRVPVYGEADAGRIWNRTLVKQLTQVQKFQQSKYDPCYFWKHLDDGTRMDFVMYVDDGYVTDAISAAAQAELDALHAAFTIEIKDARFFLGNNVNVFAQDAAP